MAQVGKELSKIMGPQPSRKPVAESKQGGIGVSVGTSLSSLLGIGGVTLDAKMDKLPGLGDLAPKDWYRFHGTEGLEDFNKTGTVRAKPGGKYTSTYFSEGALESRYQNKGGGSVIVSKQGRIEKVPDTRRYGIVDKLEKGKDRFQVLERVTDAEGKVKYKNVYDNLSAHKYYGRKVAASGGVLGLGLEALLYSGDAGEGSDRVNIDKGREQLTDDIKQRREAQEGLVINIGGRFRRLLESVIPSAGAAEPNAIQKAVGMTEAPTGVSAQTAIQLRRLEEEGKIKEKPKPTIREDKGLTQKEEYRKVMGDAAAKRKAAAQDEQLKKILKARQD